MNMLTAGRRAGILLGLGLLLPLTGLSAADDRGSQDAPIAATPGPGGLPTGASVAGKPTPPAEIWIDVRTAREYEAGHLPDARHLPYDEVAERIAAIAPDRHTPIRLYCRSGARAESARKALEKLGYTQVENRGAYADLLKKIRQP